MSHPISSTCWFVMLSMALACAGCGGGGGPVQPHVSGGQARVIIRGSTPATTVALVVHATDGMGYDARQVVPRQADDVAVLLTGAPAGMLLITVTAVTNADGTGQALAEARIPIAMPSDGTERTITINPDGDARGMTVTLLPDGPAACATAYDAMGNVVLLAPDAITWRSQSPARATIDSVSGLIAPLAPGEVTITAISRDGAYSATYRLRVTDAGGTLRVDPGDNPIAVTIEPASVTLQPGAGYQFSARVNGTSLPAVTWHVEAGHGAITPTGYYTAPTTPGTYRVRADSTADPTARAQAEVTVIPAFPTAYTFARAWGTTGPGRVYSPRAIAVANGRVYVADTTHGDYINVYADDGTYVARLGGTGTGDGQFDHPGGLALDATGRVYVADTLNHRVQVFDAAGQYLRQWGEQGSAVGQFDGPRGIAIDAAGDVYVADYGNHRVQRFTETGAFVAAWNDAGPDGGALNHPIGVAVAGNSVYVTDAGNHRVVRYATDGTCLSRWGTAGGAEGQFALPIAVAVGSQGQVFILDGGPGACGVQLFTGTGAFLARWGAPGAAEGQLYSPSALALDANDHLYLADTGNARVQVFAPSP